VGPTQLAKKHGYELTPAGKPARMALGLVLADCCLKLDAGKQL
jgi:hypothetical protein